MKPHGWNLSPKEAIRLQKSLADRVVRRDAFGRLSTVAGVDAAFRGEKIRAAAVLLRWPDLSLIEEHAVERAVSFPYVPGLLSFREVPAVLDVLSKLKTRPDLIFCDAHGYAHPRRFGLASHLGVYVDLPTVGCAKSLLCGGHGDLPLQRGARAPLLQGGRRIGTALRTREGVKPVFVSVGHRVSLGTAARLVLRCSRTRIPEPIRLADRLSKAARPPGMKSRQTVR